MQTSLSFRIEEPAPGNLSETVRQKDDTVIIFAQRHTNW